jgi:hypothetical protein
MPGYEGVVEGVHEGSIVDSEDPNQVGLHRWDGAYGRPNAFYIDKQQAVYENIPSGP